MGTNAPVAHAAGAFQFMRDRPSDSMLDMPRTPCPDDRRNAYFRANVKVIAVLLAIWAFVSFGCGILLAPWLNQFRIPGTGFKVGFWMASQGSIYVFVLLIFTYVWIMNRLDRLHGVEEAD